MGGPRPKVNQASRRSARRPPGASADDRALFLASVGDAQPLATRDRVHAPPPASRPAAGHRDHDPPPPAPLRVDAAGEYVRARRDGVSHTQLGDLAGGRVRAEAELDLHGHTVADAEAALRRFIQDAARSQRRCVLVIHGRGLHSGGGAPVRDAVIAQLVGPLSGLVHSIATAPPKNGGPGATYVMVSS